MPRVPTLVTERLVLRPPSPADLEDLTALFGDPDVMHFVGNKKTFQPTQVALMLENFLAEARHGSANAAQPAGVPGWLVIVRPDSQAFVGLGVLRMLPADMRPAIGDCPELAVEVGYLLGKDAWGQGFATEAARELVRYGVGLVGKEHVVAIAHLGNLASHAVLKKAGFEFCREFDYREMQMIYWTLG